jgi:hypothetical protein
VLGREASRAHSFALGFAGARVVIAQLPWMWTVPALFPTPGARSALICPLRVIITVPHPTLPAAARVAS